MSQQLRKITPCLNGLCVIVLMILGTAMLAGRPAGGESPSTLDSHRDGAMPIRPVHSFSIVARDPSTGELGVAVQSHWFSVGPIVPWARAGVGAVATQANVEVAHGPRGLELLAQGLEPQRALDKLLARDEGAAGRQVAIVDANGGVATHTGPLCIAFAGHATAEGISSQANLMTSERVWPGMLDAFGAASGPRRSARACCGWSTRPTAATSPS